MPHPRHSRAPASVVPAKSLPSGTHPPSHSPAPVGATLVVARLRCAPIPPLVGAGCLPPLHRTHSSPIPRSSLPHMPFRDSARNLACLSGTASSHPSFPRSSREDGNPSPFPGRGVPCGRPLPCLVCHSERSALPHMPFRDSARNLAAYHGPPPPIRCSRGGGNPSPLPFPVGVTLVVVPLKSPPNLQTPIRCSRE